VLRYLLRRVLWGIAVLLALTMSVFLLFGPVLQWKSKIEPARLYAGNHPTEETVEQVTTVLGLNKPWYVQYGRYMKRIVVGPSADECRRLAPGGTAEECRESIGRLGRTFRQQRPVDTVIAEAIPATLSLTLFAAAIWITMSIPIGIISALKKRSFFDRITTAFVLIGQALPIYYFGLLALYFLAYLPNSDEAKRRFGFKTGFDLFPNGGYATIAEGGVWNWAWHLFLPAFTLALQFAALYARMIRSNMLTAMSEDYVRTARAKGASERRVVARHALRNALLPIVTMFGLDIGILVGGAVLTEGTFGLNGLGKVAVDGATSLDVPLVAGVVLFAGLAIVIANIVVDLLYAVIDPRIRLT
jgi:peptide/nickel transport system permease protein